MAVGFRSNSASHPCNANSTVSDNLAGANGGGIAGGVTITSSTISGNTANGDGGGIWSRGEYANDTLVIKHTTITANMADIDANGSDSANGGGVFQSARRSITLHHVIVADNFRRLSTQDDISSLSMTARYSLIGDNTGTGLNEAPVGMPDADGNLIGGPTNGIIDPLLATLANNGGPTKTHALLLGSPVIDAGEPGFTPPPEFDQRGSPLGTRLQRQDRHGIVRTPNRGHGLR